MCHNDLGSDHTSTIIPHETKVDSSGPNIGHYELSPALPTSLPDNNHSNNNGTIVESESVKTENDSLLSNNSRIQSKTNQSTNSTNVSKNGKTSSSSKSRDLPPE